MQYECTEIKIKELIIAKCKHDGIRFLFYARILGKLIIFNQWFPLDVLTLQIFFDRRGVRTVLNFLLSRHPATGLAPTSPDQRRATFEIHGEHQIETAVILSLLIIKDLRFSLFQMIVMKLYQIA